MISLSVLSCTPSKEGPAKLKSGDLIFVGLPSDYSSGEDTMSQAITEATGRDSLNMIHVAIAEVEDGNIWIIDATLAHGCDRHPLDTMLKDFTLKNGSMPAFIVKRLPDSCDVSSAIKRAKSFCGQPYDSCFLPDNGAVYCSELVRESYLDSKGGYLFEGKPMNFRNARGEFPPYWTRLFERIGQPIPQGVMGTNPQDMSKSPLLKTVEVDIIPRKEEVL